MKNFTLGQVIGIPVCSSKTYGEGHWPSICVTESYSVSSINERKWLSFNWMRKFRKNSEDVYKRNRHENFSQNSSDTAKLNTSLDKRFSHARNSVERLFRKSFSVDQNERLLKGNHCYLYTTAGLIKGILFMSTVKVAFCSVYKPLSFRSPKGEIVNVPYKVLIPASKIKEIMPSKSINKPEKNYLHIATLDDFEFWFSGFVKQKTSLKNLQRAF